MDDKDPLAAMLPDPPPPSPARREQAIDTAMRRFDGETDAAPRSRPAQPTPWRAAITRPRLGAAITVALVAMIGLPMAIHEIDRRQAAYQNQATLSRAAPAELQVPPASPPSSQSARSSAQPGPSPAQPVTPPPARPMIAAAPVPSDLDGAAKDAAPPPPAEPVADDQRLMTGQALTATANAAQAERFGSLAMRRAGVAPPPPPAVAAPAPPPPPPAVAGSQEEIIVTTARRATRAGGQADDCTINDRRRDLARCKAEINAAAAGARGEAGSHVADGLSSAWAGDLETAIAEFDKAIAIRPKLAIAYLNRSLVYARMGDSDRAIDDANQAVRYAPNAQNYFNRSRLWMRLGERGKARADEARAAAIDPDYDALSDRP